MFKDNPVLMQLRNELKPTATSQDDTLSKKRPASKKPTAKQRGPIQTASLKRKAPAIRKSESNASDALNAAKQDILAQAKRWGREGTEQKIQTILIGVMQKHGVDAANKIIMETKLNKFGWTAQL